MVILDVAPIPIPSVLEAYKLVFQRLLESKGEGYWLDKMPKGLFPINRGDLTQGEIQILVETLCEATGITPPRAHGNTTRLRRAILQVRNKIHPDKIHRFVSTYWTSARDVDFRSLFAIVLLDRLATQLLDAIQNDTASNYEYPFPIYTRAFNGYIHSKVFITIFDALAIQHWTQSEISGFTKSNAMVIALQATNSQFASVQGMSIRERRTGTFLYSRERTTLLDNYDAPHLLWVDITRRVSTRRRLKVEFTLHDADINVNNNTTEGQEEDRNGGERNANTRQNRRNGGSDETRDETGGNRNNDDQNRTRTDQEHDNNDATENETGTNTATDTDNREDNSDNNDGENEENEAGEQDGENEGNEAGEEDDGNEGNEAGEDEGNEEDEEDSENEGNEAGEEDGENEGNEAGEEDSSANVRGVYDQMPSAEDVLNLADGSSMPGARNKATPVF